MNEAKTLIALELRSIYGLNKFRYTKDKKAKNRYILLLCTWIFISIMVAGYIAGLVYGLSVLELSSIAPSYLVFVSSILVFAFGIFKAGSTLFSKSGYDIVSSMPIRTRSVAIGRFISMYVEDLMLTLLIMLPGIITLGIIERHDIGFYILATVGSVFIPFIPLCLSIIFGTLVFAISSRTKHKSMIQTLFAIVFILAVLAFSFRMTQFEGDLPSEVLAELANNVNGLIGNVYPPAIWLGNSMISCNILIFAIYLLVSLSVFAVTSVIISSLFHSITRALFSFSAKHDYKLGELQSRGILKTLYLREAKRYFSSSIYVTNTIIGPIMAAIASVSLCVAGVKTITSAIPISNTERLIPFAISAILCMMTTTSVAISMEGKQFMLIKSLPVDAKALFDSKILLNLSLMLPTYIISVICMIIALKPNLTELIWIVVIPALIILFSTVFGITINLKLHSLDWENEVTVVKQSASAMIGGFAGPLVSMLMIGIMIFVPMEFSDIACLLISILLFTVTMFIYKKNNNSKLEEL